METVKCADKEVSEQEDDLQIQNADQLPTLTQVTKVKGEKINPEDCGRYMKKTKRWVVCEANELKEVKTEHTLNVSETSGNENLRENVDKKQQYIMCS